MEEKTLDIQEGKRLKKKSLLEFNAVMVLLLLFGAFYIYMKWPVFVFFGLACVALWFFTANSLYILMTGKTTGTKTNQAVQAFDRKYMGEKRWKRIKITEVILIGGLSIVCTLLVFFVDLSAEPLRFMNTWGFIGAWVGSNVGAVIRISALE